MAINHLLKRQVEHGATHIAGHRLARRGIALTTGAMGAGIVGMWGNYLARGLLKSGLFTVENNQYLIYHIAAEIGLGSTLVAAGWGLWHDAPWAKPAAYVGLGMAAYSTVNSLGHSMKNDPSLSPVLIGSFLVTVGLLAALAREGGNLEGTIRT